LRKASVGSGWEAALGSWADKGGEWTAKELVTPEEIERQEKLKTERDVIAAKLELEPTLIANRAQLVQIARDPRELDRVLLPWQADLLRDCPSLKPAAAAPASVTGGRPGELDLG
jgi:ribonuclease D